MKSRFCSFAAAIVVIAFGVVLCTNLPGPLVPSAHGGSYIDSAHGDASNGVDRSATNSLGYGRANCAHCHEQHASIEGSEPAPAGGASAFALFYSNYVNQTDNVCVQCHVDAGSVQSDGPIINRSYSYRAGAWTSDTVNDVLESFSFVSPATSHNLSDIVTFITGRWGYTANSNPCAACHNPHAAQGDPLAAPTSAKSSGTRGWPVSRSSEHTNTPWGLWGDDYTAPGAGNGERMNNYTTNYQAPYRFGSQPGAGYEPDGSTTQDGSNLTDFNTFCTDCHNTTNTISSATLGTLLKINWTGVAADGINPDIHGQKQGRLSLPDKGALLAPYNEGSGSDITLSCLDCHEPHGSNNAYFLRRQVNGVVIAQQIEDDNSNGGVAAFCQACHDILETGTGSPCNVGTHSSVDFSNANCLGCHTHGGTTCGPTNSVF